MIEGTKFRDLFEVRPDSLRSLFLYYSWMSSIYIPPKYYNNYYYNMKHEILLRLEIRLDREKAKQTKVAPYIRYRNGKKELVKGYVRKNREL